MAITLHSSFKFAKSDTHTHDAFGPDLNHTTRDGSSYIPATNSTVFLVMWGYSHNGDGVTPIPTAESVSVTGGGLTWTKLGERRNLPGDTGFTYHSICSVWAADVGATAPDLIDTVSTWTITPGYGVFSFGCSFMCFKGASKNVRQSKIVAPESPSTFGDSFSSAPLATSLILFTVGSYPGAFTVDTPPFTGYLHSPGEDSMGALAAYVLGGSTSTGPWTINIGTWEGAGVLLELEETQIISERVSTIMIGM